MERGGSGERERGGGAVREECGGIQVLYCSRAILQRGMARQGWMIRNLYS